MYVLSGYIWSKNHPGSATLYLKAPMSWQHDNRADEVEASGTLAIASSRIDQKQIILTYMAPKMPLYEKPPVNRQTAGLARYEFCFTAVSLTK